MPMKGIMRIPGGIHTGESMDKEISLTQPFSILVMRNILEHVVNDADPEFPTEIDEDHFSVFLDWAMQLRESTGRSWGECLEYAAILYFG